MRIGYVITLKAFNMQTFLLLTPLQQTTYENIAPKGEIAIIMSNLPYTCIRVKINTFYHDFFKVICCRFNCVYLRDGALSIALCCILKYIT